MTWPGNAHTQATTFGGLSRSALMARVRGRGNATTEVRFARLLRQSQLSGWRRNQPVTGRPDFIWRASRVAVFIDGCFWHGHDCGRKLTPKTNAGLWRSKILGNKERDRRTTRLLKREGWRVCRIWECELARAPNVAIRRLRSVLVRSSKVVPI